MTALDSHWVEALGPAETELVRQGYRRTGLDQSISRPGQQPLRLVLMVKALVEQEDN